MFFTIANWLLFVSLACVLFSSGCAAIIQSGREISAIILTDDYLCYKEPKFPLNFFLILIFNELFKFKTSDGRQH